MSVSVPGNSLLKEISDIQRDAEDVVDKDEKFDETMFDITRSDLVTSFPAEDPDFARQRT